ncbi:MAG TPA: hypothetical protein VJQ59_07640 [Candidatus Sulfotelmatobacter sp.]|nr:hypothetical protein [Candidatus Sulfotelmatobacter sp.]
MASKEMVTKDTREKIKVLLDQVAEEKGRLRLAMLAQSSTELPGRWSLVVSAPWMDEEGPRATINELTGRLLERLGKKELSAVDRVSVLSMGDPLVQRVIELVNDFLGIDVSTSRDGFYVSNSRIQDWDLPQAFVFVADPAVPSKAQRMNGARRRASAR